MRIRYRAAGMSALAAALVVGLLAGPAGAEGDKPGDNDDPTAGSNAAREIMAAQLPLVDAAQRFTELDKDGQLGGVELVVKKKTLNLWWKGDPPAEIRAEIERQQAEHGIQIKLATSAYSQRELVEITHGLVDRFPKGLTRIGPKVDGSGLTAAVLDGYELDRELVPVPVEVVHEPVLTPTSRGNDSAPWWAGGVTRGAFPNAGTCSTGFAIARYFLWWETTRGILTAEHCGFGGGLGFNDGAGQRIGQAEPAPARRLSDSLFITTNSGARTFDGGVGVGEFSKPVVGAVGNFPGQFVCTSGAATGVHCNIRTDLINQLVLNGGFFFVESVAIATQINGVVATGVGDSGGPVFTLAADPSKVRAAGMMTGALNPVPCQIGGQTGCFNRVAFVDLGFVLIAQQASLLTS
ncbi:hypothetical protein F4553_006111 [Allocatelliglobosispora scoriae]|uniref:Protease n=1 Tax=Allocatelliglobosispora scoriae TaxID=643052 RepID=A0A841BU98_9ACTN|nr:hypothetical protein [Allocatelliglobosispora scoriae]MBB5872677.1 hypothetical protein [Allocatelliglobosispora scoriae]